MFTFRISIKVSNPEVFFIVELLDNQYKIISQDQFI